MVESPQRFLMKFTGYDNDSDLITWVKVLLTEYPIPCYPRGTYSRRQCLFSVCDPAFIYNILVEFIIFQEQWALHNDIKNVHKAI